MQTITLSIHENHLAKLINFLVSLPKNDVKVLENSSDMNSLFGSWEDDRTADEIIQDIKNNSNDVILEKDIDDYSSLDYLAVSEDKTDKDWITNFLAMTEKASKNIATHLPQNERGWTRDDIYER
ncbi:hypothetical protein [Moraxella sp. ZY210820]|uniref:hypothetical protein n=1 Tax=unclassified Moraxella TaxID=2685852 RepID=UPI00272F607C|nr:hypothetical protein [Moraxella sp. ZY210820]WLF84596.1 hypothetical protein LU301_03745 [Moraxella sp. ZY210820]